MGFFFYDFCFYEYKSNNTSPNSNDRTEYFVCYLSASFLITIVVAAGIVTGSVAVGGGSFRLFRA